MAGVGKTLALRRINTWTFVSYDMHKLKRSVCVIPATSSEPVEYYVYSSPFGMKMRPIKLSRSPVRSDPPCQDPLKALQVKPQSKLDKISLAVFAGFVIVTLFKSLAW